MAKVDGITKDRLVIQGVVKETISAGELGSLLDTQTRPRASTKRDEVPCHKWVDVVVKPALGHELRGIFVNGWVTVH